MSLSEQLGIAISTPQVELPLDVDPAALAGGLLVKVTRLSHSSYPGRDARGVLPVLVTGHEAMDEAAWRNWVREHGIAHYGAGYTERVLRDGIELKEMFPTSGFGRHMRQGRNRNDGLYMLSRAESLITAVEKWPGLYNLIATEMGDQEMTLSVFLERISNLPAPWELGAGADTTLGDLTGPPLHMVLPDF
jgi:hypothetical protein